MAESIATSVPSTSNAPASAGECITCNTSPDVPTAPSAHTLDPKPSSPPPREHPLTHRQRLAIRLLVAGHSDTRVAAAVGVSRSTLYRWRIYHTMFQIELNRQRASVYVNNADRIRSLMSAAIDTLQRHLASDSERASFRSAISILRLARSILPSGPLDEYELLENEYIRQFSQEMKTGNLMVRWPPEKADLDNIRELLLQRSRNQAFTTPKSPPAIGHFPEHDV